MNLSHTFSIF